MDGDHKTFFLVASLAATVLLSIVIRSTAVTLSEVDAFKAAVSAGADPVATACALELNNSTGALCSINQVKK